MTAPSPFSKNMTANLRLRFMAYDGKKGREREERLLISFLSAHTKDPFLAELGRLNAQFYSKTPFLLKRL